MKSTRKHDAPYTKLSIRYPGMKFPLRGISLNKKGIKLRTEIERVLGHPVEFLELTIPW